MDKIIAFFVGALIIFAAGGMLLMGHEREQLKEELQSIEGVVQEKLFNDQTTETDSGMMVTGISSMPVIPISSSRDVPEKYILFVKNLKLYADRETWLSVQKGKNVSAVYNGLNEIVYLEVK